MPNDRLHELLRSQLARYGHPGLPAQLGGLLAVISDTYTQADAKRRRLEELLTKSSKELQHAHTSLWGILHACPDFFVRVRSDGLILDLRGGSGQPLELERSEWVGHRLQEKADADSRASFAAAFERVRLSGQVERLVFRYSENEQRWLEVRLAPLPQREMIAILRDVTEIREAEERIRHQAFRDHLTGLPNRRLFDDRLQHALGMAKRSQHGLGVFFLDLDHFKWVNDSLGHGAGDELLRAVAQRLRRRKREGDTVARFGGDEFVALVSGLKKVDHVHTVAKGILGALEAPHDVQGQALQVTASVGVSLFPGAGSDGETLLRNADTALYRAKERGRNTYRVFDQVN